MTKDYGPVLAPPPGLSPLALYVYNVIPDRYLHCASRRNFNKLRREKLLKQIKEYVITLIPDADEL